VLLDQVRSGDADLGWVGVRAFAQAGTTDFEPLIAPLLVRSYAAQREIIQSDVANGLLARLEPLGFVGLGLLPGGLRYPMSTGASLTTPADWDGLQIYTFESSIAATSIAALGAEPQLLGFDDRDAGLADGSIAGLDNTLRFHADRLDTFSHLVGDVPLWTRMSALVTTPALQLSSEERQWITAAIAEVATRSDDLAEMDTAARADACAFGDPGYVLAGQAITDFEAAFATVEQTLAASPDAAATLEALHELVADIPGESAASCESAPEAPDTSDVTLRTLIDRPIEAPSLQAVTSDDEPIGSVTYTSDGLTISAHLTLPTGSGPFPGVVLVQPFGGLERATQTLADAGYAVLQADLRGHGDSDADPSMGTDLDMGSTLDAVNAARALGSDPRIDSSKIALIGSGLAGLLVINAQVVAPDAVDAVVATNPSSLDLWQNLEYFFEPDDEVRTRIVETRGTPDDNPALWADVSPATFLDRVDAPLLVLQGTLETFNDPTWANDTVAAFRAAAKDAELTVLDGTGFDLSPAWDQASSEIETFLADSL
jgi:TRAP-type C4-dicarboxylate transport system substrate-binding protein/dienelactone hydrolase